MDENVIYIENIYYRENGNKYGKPLNKKEIAKLEKSIYNSIENITKILEILKKRYNL